MALKNHSVFYYGHKVDDTNNFINFKEGAGAELTAEIPTGSYTMTKFLEIVTSALNDASALTWTYSVDRVTRIVTLTSSGPASLLFGTGTLASFSPASLLGFAQADLLSLTSFVGTLPTGIEYAPQFPLQDYKPKDKNKKLIGAVVTKSASGDKVSVQSFGTDRFIKCNIKFITNEPSEGILRDNPTAVEDASAFMEYIIEKNPVEFMENENDRGAFDKVYLDSMSQGDGTFFELIEYVDRNLPEYYETGLLTFKVINRE